MRKVLIGGAALLVLLLVGGIVVLVSSADWIVARAIENEGTRLLGAPVRVGSVDLDLAAGSGTVHDLVVDNPSGFESERAVTFEEIELALDTKALGEQPFRLALARVDRTQVHFAVDANGRSNLDRLLGHARSAPDRSPESGEAPGRLSIGKLEFEGGSIFLERPDGDPEEFEFAGFARTGVGGAEGATGAEVAVVVTQALIRQVGASVAGREAARAVEKELGDAAGRAAGAIVREIFGN